MNERTLLALTLGVLTLIPSLLSAQTPADPDLYVAPVLTVEASANMATTLGLRAGMPIESLEMDEALAIRQHLSVETDPLLPMIFFEVAASTMPDRYAMFFRSSDADDYREDRQIVRSDIRPDPLAKYHEVLNVIGSRLRRHPGTTITLEGSYSTEPGENATIGRERAEVVKEYLQTIWTIAPERMTILPPRRACDSADHTFRQEEARRVTIESESWLIHQPVRYYYAIVERPFITLRITVDPNEKSELVSDMSVMVTSDDDLLGTTSLPVSPDSGIYRSLFLWSLPRAVEALDHGITFQLLLTMTDGTRRLSAPVTLPVRVISPPPEDEERWAAYRKHAYPSLKKGTTTSRDTADNLSEEERLALEMSHPHELTSVGFFIVGDTTLRRYQRMMIDHCIATLLSGVDERSTERYVLLLLPDGEEGENPEADPVVLAIAAASARNQRFESGKFFTDPTFRASLVPLQQWIDAMKMSDGESDFDERWRTFNRQMYGDHADEYAASYMTYGHADEEYSRSEKNAIDSVLRRRTAPVVDYIRSIMEEEVFDSIVVAPQHLNGYRERMPTLYMPEERFYARRVTLEVKRSEPDPDMPAERSR